MDWLTNNVGESLLIFGFILLIIEVLILGFSTFILFFVGLSLIISGAAVWLGILPDDMVSVFFINAVLTAVLAAVLWTPLKRFQGQVDNKAVKTDFIGMSFTLEQDTDELGTAKYQYSGITWQVKSLAVIPAGTQLIVTKAEVGVFWVEAKVC